MKLLKKASILLLVLGLSLSSACMGQQKIYSMYGGSFWLENTEVGTVGTVNEKCVYNISFTPATPTAEGQPVVQSTLQGQLVTTLTNDVYNNLPCYKFTTEIKTSGSYSFEEKSVQVNDLTTSTVYMLGLSDKLSPLYSEKSVLNTTPMQAGDSYEFITLAYTVKTEYDRENKKAKTTVDCDEQLSTEGYRVKDAAREYEDYDKTGHFFDNESLLFFPRASQLESGYTHAFYTIDALSQTLHSMSLTVNSSAPTSEFKLAEYYYNGTRVGTENNPKVFNTYNALVSITGTTFTGSSISLFFCGEADNANKKRLISMQAQLGYSSGSLTYTLLSVDTL